MGSARLVHDLEQRRSVLQQKVGVYLRKVGFADSRHGWTVGRFGYIFKTNDGGNLASDSAEQHRPPTPGAVFLSGRAFTSRSAATGGRLV